MVSEPRVGGPEDKKPPEKPSEPEASPPAGEPVSDPVSDAVSDRDQADVESFLGPDVRTPVGIPKDYHPTDSSITPLFRVELSQFAGPLDLLLYLIRKHEIEIFDIPIAFITEKYLEMLDTLRNLEIDLASEFLVMATELTHIKSKMLLPAKEGVPVDNEAEEEGDPRAELVRRLLEYQKYRDAAEQLDDRDRLGRDVFPRIPPSAEAALEMDPGLKSVSIFRLVEVMAKMIREVPVHHEISFETFSLSERIQYVAAFAKDSEGKFTLVALLQSATSRGELVITFIAVLEMTKLGFLRIEISEDVVEEDGLPEIWVHQTGKELSGEVIDDYR